MTAKAKRPTLAEGPARRLIGWHHVEHGRS
jgi:hypothetical protein